MTTPSKPWRAIPIAECGEPLVPIPEGMFRCFSPHPYEALGAPYGDRSPWLLRQSVLAALVQAQDRLRLTQPGWSLLLFDAWRPNEVQQFMVDREFALQAKAAGWDAATLTPEQREVLAAKVFRLWGIPSTDPTTPPPHSTGAVIDLTLADQNGHEVAMGSPIDENSDRSNPDYFADAPDPTGQTAHQNRLLLNEIMHASRFHRHPTEWWHFSLGDQYWAWVEQNGQAARYGRI